MRTFLYSGIGENTHTRIRLPHILSATVQQNEHDLLEDKGHITPAPVVRCIAPAILLEHDACNNNPVTSEVHRTADQVCAQMAVGVARAVRFFRKTTHEGVQPGLESLLQPKDDG